MLDKLNQLVSQIPHGSEALTAVAIVVWDVVRRLWKTAKPASFLHDAAAMMKVLSQGIYQLAEFLDSIAPQRVVDQEKNNIGLPTQ